MCGGWQSAVSARLCLELERKNNVYVALASSGVYVIYIIFVVLAKIISTIIAEASSGWLITHSDNKNKKKANVEPTPRRFASTT